MAKYIDGFVFPIHKNHLEEYQAVAEKVAEVWKEHGALSYHEFAGDDLHLEGTRSFADIAELKEEEVVVFGWVVFPSKDVRDQANQAVPKDPRMAELVNPLVDPNKMIFDFSRMIYGGFKSLV